MLVPQSLTKTSLATCRPKPKTSKCTRIWGHQKAYVNVMELIKHREPLKGVRFCKNARHVECILLKL